VKHNILHTVCDFFRDYTNTPEELLNLTQILFLWLKWTDEKVLDEEEYYIGKEGVSERFHDFIQHMNNLCNVQTYNHKLQLNDETLNSLIVKIRNSLEKGLISYGDVAEIAYDMSLQEQKADTKIPKELVQLGCDLLNGEIGEVYCPFSASYRFAEELSVRKHDAFVEFSDTSTILKAKLSLELRNVDYDYNKESSDPIISPAYVNNDGLKQFSHTLSLPPIGLKYPKEVASSDMFGRFPEKSLMGEVLQLRHMLAQTSDQVVAFVSSGFLSRTAAGEKQFKQDMIKLGLLHAVIALPERLLNNTTIQLNALVFDKRKKADNVLFIDASRDFFSKKERFRNVLDNVSELVGIYNCYNNASIETSAQDFFQDFVMKAHPNEIIKNEFNLLPSRYVFSQEQKALNIFLADNETIALNDIGSLISPQAIKDEAYGDYSFNEYGLTSLNEIGEFIGEGKKVTTSSQINRAENQLLQKDDILIVNKGSVGKVAFVEELPAENAIPSQAFTILRIDRRISDIEPVALFQYLLSPMGQLQLESMASGVAVTMISTKDLKNMRIPILSEKQTDEALDARRKVKKLYRQLIEIEQEIKQLNNINWLN
jgi:type I restriction enzyme M protein